MVESIKFNKILPSLSPASKVNRADSRGRNSQQPPFKQSLKDKQKKKKKDQTEPDGETKTEKSSGAKALPRKTGAKRADHGSRPGESATSKLIDIRV